MKRTASLAAVLLAAAAALLPGRAAAAVSTTLAIGIRADRSEFVRGEDLTISGVLRNTGSSAFIVDDYGPYLQNRIRLYLRDAATGRLIAPRPGAPASAVPSLTVRPGEEKPFTIHVGTCYDLPRHARVQATAVVERGDDESAASHPVAFTLVEGIEFTSDVRTLPGDDRRLFRFELIYWARDQVENIFLRVSDPAQDDRVVGLASLGTVVRVAEPSMTFDAAGNLKNRCAFAENRFEVNSGELAPNDKNSQSELEKKAAEATAETAAVETEATDVAPEDDGGDSSGGSSDDDLEF